ncbi:hypothetical protein F0237_21915 [Vibrio tubiashii]|uniref:EF-hand domain-containing protein n=1 Tax=Vibrio tubiashii TaxID=29498 RepID=A0AAE5LJZ5_9VIBR|nr:hypothetical protein [Vibrio tubiashii]NOI83319.1 hypothetical protein [Vibrio tubiashii]
MNTKTEVGDEEIKEDDNSSKGFLVRVIALITSGALVPALTSVMAATVLLSLLSDKNLEIQVGNKTSYQDSLFSYLEKGAINEKFNNEYFETAFKHFDRKGNGRLSSYGRTETLEDFVVFLNSSESSISVEMAKNINDLLVSSRQTDPFAQLPAEERRLMEKLQAQTDKYEDQNATKTMDELKQVLLIRHKEYQKVEEQNAWSLPLSIAGVFLTLVFGIWSTVLSIKQSSYKSVVISASGKPRPAF